MDLNTVNREIIEMRQLVAKFRLPFEIREIEIESNQPSRKTIKMYEKLSGVKINDTARPLVTTRWLRLSELLFEHSKFAGMNIVTMPSPISGHRQTPRSYMAVLHMLCDQKKMPPTLFIRGNGQNALTFYSE